jgi:hypothetical protein
VAALHIVCKDCFELLIPKRRVLRDTNTAHEDFNLYLSDNQTYEININRFWVPTNGDIPLNTVI